MRSGNASAPAVGSLAAGALAFLGFRRERREHAKFTSMNWAEADVDADNKESCVILGEEAEADGKVWYVCQEKSDDPKMDCEVTAGIDGEDEFLCKAPKAS